MTTIRRPRAIIFDTFGSVVDWRTSLIDDLTAFGKSRGINADWTALVDAWRAAYVPSMQRVEKGELPWQTLDELHRTSLNNIVADMGITGLTEADLTHINLGWHRLKPWKDSVAGLTRLKSKYIIAPLSNGTVALLTNMAKGAGLPWDMIFGSDLFHHFKPAPETYLGAARLLGLPPSDVMMAAAHNYDLKIAGSLGLMTAFFARPTEYGPEQKYDLEPRGEWDFIARDIEDLASQLGV
ncbi:MAG: haloacid dehalogenase type II [Parvibaculum sp.]|nr:haloacid dehalogenase type II [Parvibaculum sp.]